MKNDQTDQSQQALADLRATFVRLAFEYDTPFSRCADPNQAPAVQFPQARSLINAEMMQAVQRYALEQRMEELSHVQLQHGHFLTQTWSRHKPLSIEDRLAELKQQLAELEEKP